MSGILYIVSTPIGNLEDITMRALRVLNEVDIIAAEDTRHTQKLLNKYNIKTRKTSYHEHNRFDKAKILMKDLKEGMDIALVSDSGTPCISDPGWELVDMALKQGMQVTSVPGPSAAISAVTLAGFDTSSFVFYGFIPVKNRDRNKIMKAIEAEDKTVILYESPHKIVRTIKDLYSVLGDREIAIIKEITKLHEKVVRMTLEEAVREYSEEPKGEFVLVIKQPEKEAKKEYTDREIFDYIGKLVDEGMTKKDAIRKTSKDLEIQRREVYNLTIRKEN